MWGMAFVRLRYPLEIGWALFAAVNLGAMVVLSGGDGGTIPFHFIWVSLTIVYGFTVWAVRPTFFVLAFVMALTTGAILLEVVGGPTRPDELAEVPLMATMFIAMVWHARRRAAAEQHAIGSREREREFIRDASHHLKTPLALARGYAELIRDRFLDSVQDRDADMLIDELDRLTKIVNNLLLLMDSDGKSGIQRRPVDLQALIADVTDRWSTVNRQFAVYAAEPVPFVGDRERLECALDALLENAVEATESDDRIWVAVSHSDGLARIRVADEGRGISENASEHMFERFWSERGRHHRRGCGLGLAIVENIVEAHQGTIDVARRDGVTVFTLELPVLEVTTPPRIAKTLGGVARPRPVTIAS